MKIKPLPTIVQTIILVGLSIVILSVGSWRSVDADQSVKTFCNPVNLPYRFQLDEPSRREAADPTMIVYRGEYWLFPSKSGGYWHTTDFVHWAFVVPTGLQIENYAPTVITLNGKMYWTTGPGIFECDDPATGQWTKVSDTNCGGDSDLFVDDDHKVYLYYGCSPGGPITGQELDPDNGFKPIGTAVPIIYADIANRGWEIKSEPLDAPPYRKDGAYIEGSWMNKHDGTYYLQYAAPGTEVKGYGDGVYVSARPLGPFHYAPYSPFSFKPTGYICGAGHSSTFQDLMDEFWHVSTMTISVRHIFERRLGLFPTWFEPDGQMVCNTYLGDYPQFIPSSGHDITKGNLAGWMLLSYHKKVVASSTLDGHPVQNAVDEDVRTWWSAKTGASGEWLKVDLGKRCRINAVQCNFADEGSTQLGKLEDGYGYKIESSDDNMQWNTIVDHSSDLEDLPDDYVELTKPIMARYVRVDNTHTPGGALFSISGLRLFGSGLGQKPGRATSVRAVRDPLDSRQVTINWKPAEKADFYIVRYGIHPDRLYSNYQVYTGCTVHLHSLNVGVPYYAVVDSVNDTSVTYGTHPVGF